MSDPQRQDPRIEAVLSQLSHAANLGITPEELLTRAIDGLLQLMRAPAGVACLADPEGKTLEVVSVRGIRPAAAKTLPQVLRLDAGRGPKALTRPIRIGHAEVPGLEDLHARLSAEGIAGGILLPLASDGRRLGLLIAMFRAGAEPPPALSDAHLDTLQREISSALQNARVRHGLRSLNMDLLRLLTLAKILGE
ncbi:MAG: GAF domain-containing protein, partial [Candidatus Rokubacteria bacterium]|nr:GAF domain-containing protein [Candidatus Rokubacteria bacterium]